MKRHFILVSICFFSILSCFCQKLELEKASPFSAVKWEENQPIVKFNNEWYYFEKLEQFTKKEILAFCKKQYGHKWQKRFSEDLVEVLKGMDYRPNIKVKLQLSKNGITETYTGVFTLENRQSCLMYNRSNRTLKSKPNNKKVKTSKAKLLADLQEFKKILDNRSSYAQISSYDYSTAIKKLAASIHKNPEVMNINEFSNEIAKILAEIGDRHSSIKNKAFDKKAHNEYNLKLPFGLASLDNKLIAIKPTSKKDNYVYYFKEYPYLKSINDLSLDDLLNTYNYENKKAPKETKLTRGANAIQKFGALLFKNNKKVSKSIKVVFTDSSNKVEKTVYVDLTTEEMGFSSKLAKENFKSIIEVRKNKNFDDLSKILNSNIGYIKIPMMFHPRETEGLEAFIKNSFNKFSKTKALIIDLRNNPGGGREILQIFAQYIVPAKQSPWVANVAYLRTDEKIVADEKSMSGRYLYSYNSKSFSDAQRDAIDVFNKKFNPENKFDKSNFSNPFYMVLNAGESTYNKPVYIIVNENSFSAATVFTSSFKGLPNVKIAGVTTDGSSGNSRKIFLTNSKVRIKISTMLSFQRNGKTLDGNGTEPDIYIPADSIQIFTGKDTQLDRLINIINQKIY